MLWVAVALGCVCYVPGLARRCERRRRGSMSEGEFVFVDWVMLHGDVACFFVHAACAALLLCTAERSTS